MNLTATRCTRRTAARLLALSALALPVALQPESGNASVRWCKVDPGLRIGDRDAHLTVSSHLAMKTAATGAIEVIVHVPQGYAGLVQLLHPEDQGFGFGYALTEVRQSPDLNAIAGGVEIVVAALAPASDNTLPVKVEVAVIPSTRDDAASARASGARRHAKGAATHSAKGRANEWIAVDTITI